MWRYTRTDATRVGKSLTACWKKTLAHFQFRSRARTLSHGALRCCLQKRLRIFTDNDAPLLLLEHRHVLLSRECVQLLFAHRSASPFDDALFHANRIYPHSRTNKLARASPARAALRNVVCGHVAVKRDHAFAKKKFTHVQR